MGMFRSTRKSWQVALQMLSGVAWTDPPLPWMSRNWTSAGATISTPNAKLTFPMASSIFGTELRCTQGIRNSLALWLTSSASYSNSCGQLVGRRLPRAILKSACLSEGDRRVTTSPELKRKPADRHRTEWLEGASFLILKAERGL